MSLRSGCIVALVCGIALAAASPARALSIVEPILFTTWRAEPGTFSLGAGTTVGVLSLDLVPTGEYVFVDHATDWAINVDAHFPVLALPVVALYAGAGGGVYSHDPDGGDMTRSWGATVLVGAKASIRRLKPFAEIRYTTAGPDGMAITVGTRFHLFD